MENTTAETELEKKRQGTRERVRRFRAKQKEQTAADLSQVDCPIEVSKKDAHRLLVEERGLKPFNLHIIDTCIMLIKTGAADLRLSFNYHLVKNCVQHTGFEAEFKSYFENKVHLPMTNLNFSSTISYLASFMRQAYHRRRGSRRNCRLRKYSLNHRLQNHRFLPKRRKMWAY